MSASDSPDYLLKQDAADDVDIGHLCVERLFVVLRNPLFIWYLLILPSLAMKQATRDKTMAEPVSLVVLVYNGLIVSLSVKTGLRCRDVVKS